MDIFTSELSEALCTTFLPRFLYPGKISWEAFHIFEKLEAEAKNRRCGGNPDWEIYCLWGPSFSHLPLRLRTVWPSERKGKCSVGTDGQEHERHLSTFSEDVLCGHRIVMTQVSFSSVGGDPELAWELCRRQAAVTAGCVPSVTFRSWFPVPLEGHAANTSWKGYLEGSELMKSITGTGASPWHNPNKVPIKRQSDGHLSSGSHFGLLSLSVTPAATLLLSCKFSSARDQAFRKCQYTMNQSSQTGGCPVHREAEYRSHPHPQNPSAHCSWSREIPRNKGNRPAFLTVLGYSQTWSPRRVSAVAIKHDVGLTGLGTVIQKEQFYAQDLGIYDRHCLSVRWQGTWPPGGHPILDFKNRTRVTANGHF